MTAKNFKHTGYFSTKSLSSVAVFVFTFSVIAFLSFGMVAPSTASAIGSQYCDSSGIMTLAGLKQAVADHQVVYGLSEVSGQAILTLSNYTNCSAPISVAAYKMFGTSSLSDQQYYSGAGTMMAPNTTTTVTTSTPDCKSQIDMWYGINPPQNLSGSFSENTPAEYIAGIWTSAPLCGITPPLTNSCLSNHTPSITLFGNNIAASGDPFRIVVPAGQTFVDPGYSASDQEDGNLTSKVIVSGTVDVNAVAVSTLTYTVSDSCFATTSIIREVLPFSTPSPVPTALIKANGFVSSTTISYNTAANLTWTSTNATSCTVTPGNFTGTSSNGQTTGNLTSAVTYTLSCTGPGGSATSSVIVNVLPQPPQCIAPTITSSLTASAVVGQPFTYTLTASSSPAASLSVVSSTLPGGMSFSTTTGIISGTPVQSGNFYVSMTATNQCGSDNKTLFITVNPAQCSSANLILNGSFESPAIPSGKTWEEFPVGTSDIKWNGYWVSTSTVYGSFTRPIIPFLELDGIIDNGMTPYSGGQSAELDSGWLINNGVYQGGIPASVGIYQDVSTVVGHQYKLQYAFGARPGYDATQNHMGVYVNGVLAREVSAANTGSQTVWTVYVDYITATSSITRVEFRDLGTSDTYGTQLDEVSFTDTCNVIVPPTALIKANGFVSSTTISYNTAANLTWTSTNATSCTVTPGNFTGTSSNGQTTGNLTSAVTYTLSCTGPGGSATSSVIVNVLPQPPQCIAPTITSSLTASAVVGQPFTYTLTASSSPASTFVSTSTMPDGLSFATSTGILSGAPTVAGTYNIGFTATNSCGSDSKVLVLTVSPANCPIPSITSSLAASGTVGQAFSYTIAANNVTSYKVATSSLPAGLSFSGNMITGTPTQSGTFNVSLTAMNQCGSDIKTLVITISPNNPPSGTGSVRFCLLLSDNQNVLATTSNGLPTGTFVLNLATTSNVSTSTIFSRTWTSGTFSPNSNVVLNNVLDGDCITYSNLPYGTYYYSQASVSGSSQWGTPKYSDQETQPINNIFDFFSFSSTNTNADGIVTIDATHTTRTVSVLDSYSPAGQCLLPQITSSLSATTIVGQPWSYTVVASSTAATTTINVSNLPTGLSFVTSTGIISGTPTTTGTFNISIVAGNQCGTDSKTLVLTVNSAPCTVDCGGGGGGGADITVTKTVNKSSANVSDTLTYTITATNNGLDPATNVSVSDLLPSALTFVSATSTAGSYSSSTGVWTIGNMDHSTSVTLTITATINSGTAGSTISNTANITASSTDPNPGNNTSTVTTTVNTPSNPPSGCTVNCGGGNGPICIGTNCNGSADLTLSKFVNPTEAKAGDTVTYTVTITNHGASNATNVSVNDVLPAGLTLVSASTTVGSYATSTGIWTVGSLSNGSSAVLSMIATVNGGAAGAITNTATVTSSQNDPNPGDNTGHATVTVTVPGQCYYLLDYLRKDWNNNPIEVKKLQLFLNAFEGANLDVNGIYDNPTITALDAFQWKYRNDILTPWGHTAPTDFTYILTKKKVNEIYCQRAFPVTTAQQEEIDAYRNFLLNLNAHGINIPVVAPAGILPGSTTTPATTDVVGQNTGVSSSTSNLSTLAAVSSTTRNLSSRLTANLISSLKGLSDLVFGILPLPVQVNACLVGCRYCGWLNWILIILLAIVSYLWYREYRNNRKIADVNKEIDLG